jgi:hypothetical protein
MMSEGVEISPEVQLKLAWMAYWGFWFGGPILAALMVPALIPVLEKARPKE